MAPPARKPSSSTPKGDKRSRVTKPVARVRAQAIKPSGTKKAEPGQLDKQAATKQTDGKQADGKQADTKQTDAGQSDTKQAESKQADGAKDQSAQQDGAQSNAEKGKSKAKH